MWKSSNGSSWHHLVLDPDFCYSCLIFSVLPCSCHRLMVFQYHSKREKFQMAKRRAAKEQRPVCKLEWVMDVELFLDLQSSWPKNSPHCLVILHEMFGHAAIEVQKEVEQTVCQGHWLHMPQLNPEVGIPTVQLVGPQMIREELMDIYLEVYKLHRQSGSPPVSWPFGRR